MRLRRYIILTIRSALSTSPASGAATATSTFATLHDRFIAALGMAFGTVSVRFPIEVGFDVILEDGLDLPCAAASGGDGFAYTVKDRIFLVLERVSTGMAMRRLIRYVLQERGGRKV